MKPTPPVDVAISVYGKPYQTVVTLLSLLRYSEQWINKIYVTIDKQQPEGADFTLLRQVLEPYNVVYYEPLFFIPYSNILKSRKRYLLHFPPFRKAVRYQYAWEKTDRKYLFFTHNDVLYTGDLIKEYLENIGDGIGIGKVGQCWNCPAFMARKCGGEKYWQYRPSFEEVKELYDQYGSKRGTPFYEVSTPEEPWPFPECRLNEYASMINMQVARPVTLPNGPALPYGLIGNIDTGSEWFRKISLLGYKTKHFDFDPYAQHAWTNGVNNGNQALHNRALYDAEEQMARQKLQEEFGLAVADA